MADIDFGGGKGINVGNPKFARDTVNLITLQNAIATVSGNTVSAIVSGITAGNNISITGTTSAITVSLTSNVTTNSINAGTILSAGTDLYSIFITQNDGNDIARVTPGSNISTGGTANNPIVNVIDSPSFNNISFSGIATGNGLSANTLSGGTILSGNTDLYSIFADGTGTANTLPLWLNSTGTLTDSIITQSGTGVTVNGSVNILGNVDILGTATTFNTQTVQSLDNNILLNYSGTYITAYGGGISVLSGRSNGSPSTWTIDSNGSWSANTDIIASALTINNGNINVTGGQIQSDSITATTISGGTFFSGSTPLQEIINNYTTGATFIQPSQVVYGSSTSGLTSSTGLTFSGGILNVGDASLPGGALSKMRVGLGSSFMDFGERSSGLAAIWFNQTIPSTTNYALRGGIGQDLDINAASTTSFQFAGTTRYTLRLNYSTFTPSATSGGADITYQFNAPAHLAQTLSTNIPVFKVIGANKQWATGTLPIQYFNYLSTNTVSFVGASTATTVGNLVVDYTQVGTNAFVTNNYALYVPFTTISATTNGYGAYFEAPTGATNNYALGVSGNTMFVTNVSTTNFDPYFTFKAGSVECLRILAAGGGTSSEVRVGGTAGSHWLRVSGNHSTPFVVDSGYGGFDYDTFIAFHRNSSERWRVGKSADNDFRIINVASGSTAMTVSFSTGEVNLMKLKVTGETILNTLSANTISATTSVTTPLITGLSNLVLNASLGNLNLRSYGQTIGAFNANNISFTPVARNSSANSIFIFNPPANTNQTSSSEVIGFDYNPSTTTQQWATGNIGTQREVYLRARIYSFVSASTITNAFGFYAEQPTAGANATFTNRWAAGFYGNVKIDGSSPLLEIGGALSVRGTSLAFNRNVNTGAIYNSSTYAYQWNKTSNTASTLDYLALQVYNGAGSTLSTAAISINGDTNIGIGTTSQTAKLHLRGTTSGAIMKITNSGGDNGFVIDNSDLKSQFYGGGGLNYPSVTSTASNQLGVGFSNTSVALVSASVARLVISGSSGILLNGNQETYSGVNTFFTGNTLIETLSASTIITGALTASTIVNFVSSGISNSAQTIDWNISNNFDYELSANTIFTFSNNKNGQTVIMSVSNNTITTGLTSSFTAGTTTIKWRAQTTPIQTPSTGRTDIFTFIQSNGIIYGVASQNF